MRIENQNNVAEVYGDIQQNTVAIKSEAIDKIVAMLSTKLYSAPIESFFREIVSNAWDSHVEAGNNNPVLVRIGKDTEAGKMFVLIRDYGTGLSPERFNEVYRYMGGTTKDESDNYIGAFGLGKFTSLAVSDMVYITSFYEGTEYTYLMYKNGNGISIDLMNEADTVEANGLSVVVKLDYSNYSKVNSAIRSQLMFFDSVLYENLEQSYYSDVFNRRVIIEKDTFSTHEDLAKLSVLLGKCVYPLAVHNMNISSSESLLLNTLNSTEIALKFDIGELDVNPTRETLHYTEKTCAAIVKKAREVLAELTMLKTESLNDGVIDEALILNLPSPTRLDLMGKSLVIPTYKEKVMYDGKEYSYDNLKYSVDVILSRGVSWAEKVLSNGSFTKMKGLLTLDKLLKFKKSNYSPSEYKNLEKKFIRLNYNSTYVRENWAEFSKTIGFRRDWVQKFKNTHLSKSLYHIVVKKLNEVKKFDISGLDDNFREVYGTKRQSGGQDVKVRYFSTGRTKREKISEIMEVDSPEIKVVAVTDYDTNFIQTKHVDNSKFKLVVVSDSIRQRLLKKGALTLKDWVLTFESKVRRDEQLSGIFYNFDSNEVRSLMYLDKTIPLDPLIKDAITQNFSYNIYSYALGRGVVDLTPIDKYKPILEVMEAFNFDSEKGKAFFWEKLEELKLVKSLSN